MPTTTGSREKRSGTSIRATVSATSTTTTWTVIRRRSADATVSGCATMAAPLTRPGTPRPVSATVAQREPSSAEIRQWT